MAGSPFALQLGQGPQADSSAGQVPLRKSPSVSEGGLGLLSRERQRPGLQSANLQLTDSQVYQSAGFKASIIPRIREVSYLRTGNGFPL